MDLNFDEVEEVPLPFQNAMKTFWLPKTVKDCDVFIDVPVLKVINLIGLTCAMKNMVGIAPGMKYGWPKLAGYPPGIGRGLPHQPGLIEEMIVDIVSVSRIDLVIVDGIVGLERNRTVSEGGLPCRLNTIVAGADPVAVDAVCTRLVGFNPDDFEFITLAERQGIGVGDLAKITLRGQPLEEVETRFEKKPAQWGDDRAYYGQSNRVWILKGVFELKDPGRWVNALCQAPDGTMYIATLEGVGYLKDGEWQALLGLPKALASEGARAVGVGPDGSLWLGFRGWGVARYDGERWTRWTTKTGLGDNHVGKICIGPAGQVALEFSGAGIGWYDRRRWWFFDEEDGLLGRHVSGMVIDGEGNVWVTGWGSGQYGLSRFDGEQWATAVLSKWATCWCVGKEGNLWLSTDEDISVFSPRWEEELAEVP